MWGYRYLLFWFSGVNWHFRFPTTLLLHFRQCDIYIAIFSICNLVYSVVSLLRLPVWEWEVRFVFFKNHSQHHAGLNRETFHKSFVSVLCILSWTYTYRYCVNDEQSYIFLWTWSFYLNMLTENMHFCILNMYEAT
jgi:hypothetical protein